MNTRYCFTCEEPIPDARRKAQPNATNCLPCQEKIEKQCPPREQPIAYFTQKQAMAYLYEGVSIEGEQEVMDELIKSGEKNG